MGKFIVKLPCDGTDYYLEWSTVVDAPTTYGMTLEEFKAYYLGEYGRANMGDLTERLERCDDNGVSSRIHKSRAEVISCNRAGENETELTLEQIIDKYVRNRPKD